MQSTSVFLDLTKVADFQLKNADVSRAQWGLSRGLYVFFELFLGKMMLTPKIFNHLLICVNLCHHAKNLLIPFVHS